MAFCALLAQRGFDFDDALEAPLAPQRARPHEARDLQLRPAGPERGRRPRARRRRDARAGKPPSRPHTDTSGNERNDTILSGALQLWQHGLGAIAIIVITASIIIPILKLVGLGWIIFSVRRGAPKNARRLTRIYVALDFIGRWSMLDVFLAAFLTGLVQFGELCHGPGEERHRGLCRRRRSSRSSPPQAFDPRAIWARPAGRHPARLSHEPATITQSLPRSRVPADLDRPPHRRRHRRLDGRTTSCASRGPDDHDRVRRRLRASRRARPSWSTRGSPPERSRRWSSRRTWTGGRRCICA